MPERDPPEESSASSLLEKLRMFAATLEPRERQLLAALLAPGVEAAWDDAPLETANSEGDEVTGFGVRWHVDRLPEHLSREIRGRSLRIEGW
jgi:hypothetical protein